MAVAVTLHLLCAIIWIGGMFFAYMALRPAAGKLLEPRQRLPLWSQTLARFFVWVWTAIIVLPLTGFWMIFNGLGGFAAAGLYVHFMTAAGILMILLFLHLFFAPYRRLRRALARDDLAIAGTNLAHIRSIVLINLILGMVVAIVGASGPYWS